MRPVPSLTDLSGRFVAVLIDTSGSMRRNGIWEQVGLELDRVLADLGPTDRIALYRFSNQSESVVSFDESQSVAAPWRGVIWSRAAFGNSSPVGVKARWEMR